MQCLTALFLALVVGVRSLSLPIGSFVLVMLFPLAITVGPIFSWLAGLGVWVWDKKHGGFVELDPVENRITYRLLPWFDMAFGAFLVGVICRIP